MTVYGGRRCGSTCQTSSSPGRLMGMALKSEIRARYGLAEVQQAVADYEGEMTSGKILIIP